MSWSKHAARSRVPPRPPLPAATIATNASVSSSAMTSRHGSAADEADWARAIQAVKVQKMSLRSAAQLYGVHHMALYRRVRGRYAASVATSFDIRSFLSEADEAEVLGVLREQFLHEHRITSDDIRFVVRAVASHGGERTVPPEFPPSRWVVAFKRAHGFMALNSYTYPPVEVAVANSDGDSDGASSSNSSDGEGSYELRPPQLPPRYALPSYRSSHARAENERKEDANDDQQQSDHDRDDVRSFTSRDGFETSGTTTTTTGSSCSSFASSEQPRVTPAADANGASSSSTTHRQQPQHERTYKLSHTVPPETWEKAIAAVEQQGMSLRAAARAYGVHFAALHRRVKKRAQGDAAAPMDGYFHPDDEAGIIRVVVARAELGVLMTFDELMDLVQRAALHNLPDISVDAARKLMARFQARNEHSTRHIIVDWPLPRMSSISWTNNSSHTSGSASTVRVVRTSSRPSVIVTNTSSSSSDASVARAAVSLSSLGTTVPPSPPLPVRTLASSLGVGHTNASMQLHAAPLRTVLPSTHALTVRVPPPPPLPPSNAKRSSSSKSSSRTFV